MLVQINDILDHWLPALAHNPGKITLVYFLLFFSGVSLLLFPIYMRNGGTRLVRMVLVSLVLAGIVYLLSVIYSAGGFNV